MKYPLQIRHVMKGFKVFNLIFLSIFKRKLANFLFIIILFPSLFPRSLAPSLSLLHGIDKSIDATIDTDNFSSDDFDFSARFKFVDYKLTHIPQIWLHLECY